MSTAYRGWLPRKDSSARTNSTPASASATPTSAASAKRRRWCARAPRICRLSILRPSIVVGDSRTGVTTSFNTAVLAPASLCAAALAHRCRDVPRRSSTWSRWSSWPQAVVHLAWEPRAVGRSASTSAPARAAAPPSGKSPNAAARFFHVPPPRFVNPGAVSGGAAPAADGDFVGASRRVLRAGRFYRPYLDMQLEFDTSRRGRVCSSPRASRPPRVMDYLERLFAFCVESDWGRLPAPQRRCHDSPRCASCATAASRWRRFSMTCCPFRPTAW